MTFQIIIRGKEENRRKLKGKTVSEFAKNMESIGWPSEFINEEHKDRVKCAERRNERPLDRRESTKISREMGFNQRRRMMSEIAREKDCTHFEQGYPDRDEHGDIIHRK